MQNYWKKNKKKIDERTGLKTSVFRIKSFFRFLGFFSFLGS